MGSRYSLKRLHAALACKHPLRGPPRFGPGAGNNASSECPDCGALWLNVSGVEVEQAMLEQLRQRRRAHRTASQKK